jgi:hypothetical protein
MKLKLAGDLLDRRIQDRNGRYIGTADSVILEIHGSGPPTVKAIEIGVPSLLRRVHRRLATLARRFPVTHLPLSRIRVTDLDLEADVDAERHSTLLLVEKWLRTHLVEHIPGNGR